MILLNKKLGETPLEALNRAQVPKPATYAGRLDPMAEGLLVVLHGDECKKKEEYLGLDKEYDFEMLLGFETDSGDLLGLVTSEDRSPSLSTVLNDLRKVAARYVGKHTFEYPDFSSRTINGKPLFSLTRSGEVGEVEKPVKEVEIFSLEIISERVILADELMDEIAKRIAIVKGDFRQQEVVKVWTTHLKSSNGDKESVKPFKVISGKIHCSSGTYIRTVVSDLARQVAQQGCLFSLKRTKVGPFLLSGVK